jgi:hypothetical protein
MSKKIVTNLEISKKFKELGIIQESIFYWKKRLAPDMSGKTHDLVYVPEKFLEGFKKQNRYIISAWTCTELGYMCYQQKVYRDPNEEAESLIDAIGRYYEIEKINQRIKEWRNA